jgi:TPR repeat protein
MQLTEKNGLKMEESEYYQRALKAASGDNPDYEIAALLLDKAAKAGSSDALYALGSWYFHGRHFERDLEKGIAYWNQAADVGSTDAMLELGKFFEHDELGNKDLEKAFCYYLDAALRGNGQACYEICRFFYYGFFVPRSEKISDVWRDKAENLGYKGAVEE